MRYVHISRTPGQTRADYEAVLEEMGGELPTGLLMHVVGEADGGLHIVDVWESKAVADRFAAEQLFPAFQRTGRRPGEGASYIAFETDDVQAVGR